ncbi:MAG TPA: ribosome small subunit-dependent GTPase A [Vicinamibacteria bacterium]|nr:ribosome small subunit-dependent GTPase A [Vicinamibacteria bacterium]
MKGPGLRELGLAGALAEAFAPFAAEGLLPGRVVGGHSGLLRVRTDAGELLADVAGGLRHQACGPADLPTVGDWVALRLRDDGRRAVVNAVLPRRTAFVRRAAGDRSVAQVLAANVDTVFLVMGLDGDFNPRRLERALVLAWESGAEPVVLLNKADLCPEVEARRSQVEAVASGVPVRVIAAKPGEGLEALAPWLTPGRTVALLGSSGVGKSTLVNRLLGREKQKTREVRESDQRGRHTTTHRELVLLPGGALLLDTPGLREIQLWSDGAGLEATFEDVQGLAASCRFGNCGHVSEPGCAVRAAVEDGRLPSDRLASFHKLRAELRAMEVREDPLRRREERNRWKAVHKAMRHPKRG